MPLRGRRFVLVALMWSVAGGVLPAFAQDPTRGRVTLAGETASFGAPLGFWDPASNRVSVAFFTKAPSGEAEAASRKAGRWDATAAGPSVLLDLDFVPGASSAMAGQLASCHMTFVGFRTPLGLKGGAKECHIVSIGGLLRSGGAMVGLLEGQGKTYSLRLPFSVAFLDSPVAAPAAAAAPVRPAGSPIPAGTVSGSAEYTGQRLAVTDGLAWWHEGNGQVRVALFDHAPAAGMLAELRTGSWGAGGPTILVYFEVKPGAASEPAAVTYCFVNADFPRGGSMGANTTARGCGLAEFDADVKPGGRVAARLKGQAPGPGEKPYSWDLRFNLPIAK